MDILAKKKTLTSQFLMPLLFENKQFSKIIPDYETFNNAYIADFDKPIHDNRVILVFNTKQKDLPELNRVDHYTRDIKDKKNKSNTIYIYVYDIPEDLSENYTMWLMGKYSMFTDRAKQIILNFWEAGENTLLYGALYKKGDAIPKFYKKHFNKNINAKWINDDEEWWIEPSLAQEIYGTD
jgi:hypothetical protein